MLLRIVVFYVLAFALTVVLGGAQQAAKVSAETVILAQWGPGLAALLMLLVFRKDRLRITFSDRNTRVSRYLFAALLPVGGAAIAFAIHRLVLPATQAGISGATPWLLSLWFPLGAIGEELGWRGYLHKRLDAGAAGLASSVIVGSLWALWHVGVYQNGALYVAFFVLLMISYSVVIRALVAGSGYSVLLAAIFHLMINAANLFTYSLVNQTEYMVVTSLVWLGIAIVMLLARRGQPADAVLSRRDSEAGFL